MQKTICLLAMFAAIAANMAFSQKNNIHIQTGLFHYFFDKSDCVGSKNVARGLFAWGWLASRSAETERIHPRLYYGFILQWDEP